MLEFLRIASAEVLNTCNCFLNLNLLILLLFGLGRQPLPRQLTANEVHEHNANLLQVVPPGLLNAQVSVQGGVASCAS